MKEQQISIVVPAYNEGSTIAEVVERLLALKGEIFDLQIIVVDDGSRDNTMKEVARFPKVEYVRHPRNMGKGAAISSGIKRSTGEIIVIQDADLEYMPEDIPKLVQPIVAGKADVVFGSRLRKGVPEGMSLSHYVGNIVLSIATTISRGVRVTDVMTGYKAFVRRVFDTFDLEDRGFAVEVEVASKCLRNGWRFHEVPIAYRYRQKGVSKIRFIDGARCFLKLFG